MSRSNTVEVLPDVVSLGDKETPLDVVFRRLETAWDIAKSLAVLRRVERAIDQAIEQDADSPLALLQGMNYTDRYVECMTRTVQVVRGDVEFVNPNTLDDAEIVASFSRFMEMNDRLQFEWYKRAVQFSDSLNDPDLLPGDMIDPNG